MNEKRLKLFAEESGLSTQEVVSFLQKTPLELGLTLPQTTQGLSPSLVVSMIADCICQPSISPEMAGLLTNYLALRLSIPLIIIRKNEQGAFRQALQDPLQTRLFLARKLKECVYGEKGDLFFLIKDYGTSAVYKSPSQAGQEIIEWHELNEAISKWEN